MTNLLSRFQIVEGNPPRLPHKCSVCGSINGTFIDFGLDLEFYGTVYLCLESCITQLANELGYRSAAQHKIALEAVEEQRSRANLLEDKVKDLEDVVGVLRRIGDYGSGASSDAVPPESDSIKSNAEPVKAEPKSSRQGSKQRSHDVRPDDVLNSFFDAGAS